MNPYVVLITFPVIFLGELPDKTMFASLVMATKGRPFQVWLGACIAFVVHVAIAVTIGVALFKLLPHAVVDSIVAALFLAGAVYSWRSAADTEGEEVKDQEVPKSRVMLTAIGVIFLAEWGDLTQILTANLAAKYHNPWSVGVGATLALWAVAGVAVAGGQTLFRLVDLGLVRRVTAVILVALAAYSVFSAFK